ncbi:hypothetical protein BH10PSE12_BH10PSE12_23710 [soil metagenome]
MSKPPEGLRAVPFWALGALVACLFAVQIQAFHWGVITPDTVEQWGQALSGRYDDWHPPATAWLWRQLMPFGPGTAPVLVFGCGLYWLGVTLIAEAMRRRGHTGAMLAVVLCAVSPIPFGQMGAILKDPLLAACCLTAGGLLLWRNRTGEVGRIRPLVVAIAMVVLVFASATRINAVFATAPLLAAFAPRGWTARPRGLIATLGVGAILLVAGSQLIDTVALRPHRSQPIFSLVNFDLAGIVAHGGADAYPNLDRATARAITAQCYDPGMYNAHDTLECEATEDNLSHFAASHGQSALAIWASAIRNAPGAYVRHRIAHLNRNWRFMPPQVPNDAVYVMTTANAFGLDFRANGATRIVATGARAMARSPLGRPATWVAIALGLLMIGWRLPSRHFIAGMAGSALFYSCGYAVVSVAPDLRYNLWTMLASAMALIVAVAELRGAPAARPPRAVLILSAVPVVLVVFAEWMR